MRRTRAKYEVSLELVPLIDVVFLLLIFFMVSATFLSESRINIVLPQAKGETGVTADSSVNLSIDENGFYSINEFALSERNKESLVESLLLRTRAGESEQVIVLSADARTDYQSVITALDALSSVGLDNISMKTLTP